jgi:hypothetical protein
MDCLLSSNLSGHVIDQQTKEPIIGASVYIRKNNIGWHTDNNSYYRMKIPDDGCCLVEVAHTRGTNIMPTLKIEKHDFIVENLELKYGIVTPVIHSHLIDTSRIRCQWDGTVINSMGETADNLFNHSDDKRFETRHKLNLKYKLNQHTINLNNNEGLSIEDCNLFCSTDELQVLVEEKIKPIVLFSLKKSILKAYYSMGYTNWYMDGFHALQHQDYGVCTVYLIKQKNNPYVLSLTQFPIDFKFKHNLFRFS